MTPELVTVTEELLRSGRSKKGDWKADQFALIGISWPPRRGWKHRVIGQKITLAAAEQFIAINGRPRKPKKKKKHTPEQIAEMQKLAGPDIVVTCNGKTRPLTNRERRRANMDAAVLARDEVTAEARRRGIELECSFINGSQFEHWMFNDAVDGRRLLNYWPSTGRCHCEIYGASFNVAGAMDALDSIRV